MSEIGGFDNLVLPSTQPSLGEIMQHGSNLQERNFERQAALLNSRQALEYRMRQQQEANAAKNSTLLHGLSKQFNSDNIDLKDTYGKMMKGIMDDPQVQQASKTLPHSEFQALIDSKVVPMAQAFDRANADYKSLQQGLTEYHQDLPNVSRTDARNMANMFFAHNHFKDDGTGKLTFNPDAQPIDYISKLKEPDVLKHMNVDQAPLVKLLTQEIPHEAISGKEVIDDKGRVHKHAYKGFRNAFSNEAPTLENGQLMLKMKSDNVHGIPQAPQQLEDMVNGNLQAQAAYNHLWGNAKDKIVSNGGVIDPRAEAIQKKALLYHYADPIMSHRINVDNENKVPRERISINVNGTKDVPYYNGYEEARQYIKPEGSPLSSLPSPVQKVLADGAFTYKGRRVGSKDLLAKVGDDGRIHLFKINEKDKTEADMGSYSQQEINNALNTGAKQRATINRKANSDQAATPSKPTTVPSFLQKK